MIKKREKGRNSANNTRASELILYKVAPAPEYTWCDHEE